MTKDFSKPLIGVDKKPMKRTTAEDSPVATMADVVGDALLGMTEADGKISGEEKNKRYKLWKKIDGGGEKSISLEEATLIKQVVGNVFGTLVMGQIWEFLEEN